MKKGNLCKYNIDYFHNLFFEGIFLYLETSKDDYYKLYSSNRGGPTKSNVVREVEYYISILDLI